MSEYSELKGLAEAATPYKWSCDNQMVLGWLGEEILIATAHHESGFQMENAAFIAAANPAAVLALIAEVERLQIRNRMLSEVGCEYCGGSGHVHLIDGEYLGECDQCQAYELSCTKHERNQLKAEVEALRKDAERLKGSTAFVKRLCDSAGKQPSVATGYLHDILADMSKEVGQ